LKSLPKTEMKAILAVSLGILLLFFARIEAVEPSKEDPRAEHARLTIHEDLLGVFF
jgi:hypothetical protein